MSARPVVEVTDLHRVYRMGEEEVRALDGVSILIREGELVSIMGQSGSGKSTLMNMIGCLDTPTSGSYRLADIPVETLDAEALAEVRNKHIGFVFQSFHLLPRQTALDNVLLPLVYRKEDRLSSKERKVLAAAALDRVGLGDRMSHRPNEMSGGQRQRVAIARALVADPSIILADEPTGNLDSTTGAEVLELLVSLQRDQGKTVIIVTHESEIAERTERVIRLRDGRVQSDEWLVEPSAEKPEADEADEATDDDTQVVEDAVTQPGSVDG